MRSRDAILDATRHEIGESGFDGVSIARVAHRAGVSRQTVYSIFGTREDLVSQAITDRLEQVSGAFSHLIDTAESPLELFVELLVTTRHLVLDDPMLRVLTLTGTANPIFDPGSADRAREYARTVVAPVTEAFPELTDHVDDVVELGIHLGWSVLCLSDHDNRDDDELRAFLTRWLSPAFAQIAATRD